MALFHSLIILLSMIALEVEAMKTRKIQNRMMMNAFWHFKATLKQRNMEGRMHSNVVGTASL